ncbi:MAG: RHS repeat-associated core domain-containing protein [Verrucomicrobiaceae bacterium]|nr:RHS repeat-associated core domain-containing protein [Verrucomicrobiaceae bacterium]
MLFLPVFFPQARTVRLLTRRLPLLLAALLVAQTASCLTDDAARSTTWHYDRAGRAFALDLANGQRQENAYDPRGLLTARTLKTTAGAVIASFAWTHDASGNVLSQSETWPGSPQRAAGTRLTEMSYHPGGQLHLETITAPGEAVRTTAYEYDGALNRSAKVVSVGGVVETATAYTYNAANQLVAWTERDDDDDEVLRTASLSYDTRGNRSGQTITLADATQRTTAYQWDHQNRLLGVSDPDGGQHAYAYDYRTRRISRDEPGGATAVSWSGGLSLAEYPVSGLQGTVADPGEPSVEYRRGPDMGGGIGGLLHSLRDGVAKYNLGNGRGDIVAQSDQAGALTWTASYEAFGKRPLETGTNADRQRANTKEEDPTGLLWEHFRYRDLETGVWLSRDPAGFVDGPNLYAYVRQNPWTKFDPLGLFEPSSVGAVLIFEGAKQVVANPIPHAKVAAGVAVVAGAIVVVATTESSGSGIPAFKTNAPTANPQPVGGEVDHFTMSQQISDPGKISVHTEGGSYDSNDDGGWTQTSGQNIGTRGNPDSGGDSSPTESAKEVSISGRGPGFPEQTVLGPPNARVRTSNRPGAEKAVELTYPDGVVKDISPTRVKGSVPNNHPKAPPGATTPIHFDNPINVPKVQPHKRVPTQDELDTLDNATN